MKAPVILLDTHVVVWLYAGEPERIAPAARRMIEANDIATSPIVELQLAYLNEIGRISPQPAAIVGDLATRIGLSVAQVSYAAVCAAATDLSWTRDPFDRLQAAHATLTGTRLITIDTIIRQHVPLACWD